MSQNTSASPYAYRSRICDSATESSTYHIHAGKFTNGNIWANFFLEFFWDHQANEIFSTGKNKANAAAKAVAKGASVRSKR